MSTASTTQSATENAATAAGTTSGGGATTSQAETTTGTTGTAQAAASGTETAATTTTTTAAEPARIVPEKYTLTLPEGYDADDAKAVAALAKEHQWTNEEAQAALEASHSYAQRERAEMRRQLEADPEVGGANLAQAQQHALKVLDRFLPANTPEGAEFRKLLNKTGYGDQRLYVKLLSRVGKAMSEDGMVVRDPTQSGAIVDPVERLYGKRS